jgi:twitching motility protein PilJ
MTMDTKPSLSSNIVNGNGQGSLTQGTIVSQQSMETKGGGAPEDRNGGPMANMTYRGVHYTSGQSERYAPSNLVLSRRSRLPLLQWFYNLPVRNKQLMGLVSSEIISVVGLVGVSSLLIISGGRLQLLQQAKAELAVADIQYDIKINQMGFGFRGQSDNVAIIEAAETHAAGYRLSTRQRNEAREILQNEITARNIEYATLVGSDGTIIASANADRVGEPFDPNGLVSQVLRNPEQIKTSAIVAWEELQKESPPLAEGFENEDALIRYTVTPVFGGRSDNEDEVVGVLVSGDVVNRKLAIAEGTVNAFESGYSGVYLKDLAGNWVLAASAERDSENGELGTFRVISDTSLLDKALAADGQVVTQRLVEREGGTVDHSYTMAAHSISDINSEPIAVLVRGTSEENLNQLIGNSLKLQFLIAAIALLADIILAQLLGRSIVSPLKRLQQATESFAGGDRRVRAEVFARDEVGQVASAFNELANTISQSESSLIAQSEFQTQLAQRSRLMTELITDMRKLMDRDKLFRTVVRETRFAIATDRVIIYLFDDQWQGTIVAESVASDWQPALGAKIADPCFAERYVEPYRQGRVQANSDIFEAGLTDCHLQQLEPFKVRANLVVPIVVSDHLLGLLIAHECRGPRQWSDLDIDFLKQAASQLGVALEQVELWQQRETARLEAEALSEERRQRQEMLQRQLLNLLEDVEGAAQGDLTVRADVTAGEIGTVADFFNSIVESLRQIVTQVKTSATQVNTSLGQNEDAIRTLAQDALQQAAQTTETLDSVEAMTQAIARVSDQAQSAAQFAKSASVTAEAGETAMDLTVQNILGLRETVGETAKKVKRLGESSQQISKVVSLINQIAMQTNLLAINAGIEAARAGEEGQGFAAVAEEVGDLAARSAAATRKLNALLKIFSERPVMWWRPLSRALPRWSKGPNGLKMPSTVWLKFWMFLVRLISWFKPFPMLPLPKWRPPLPYQT